MGFHHFLVFLFAPLTSFPKAVHAFLGLTSIEITHDLAQLFQFLHSLDVPQQLEEIHLSGIQWCPYLFHNPFILLFNGAKVQLFFEK